MRVIVTFATGYCRTFGQRLPNGERREWLKPIMFSGGVGQVGRLRSSANQVFEWLMVVHWGCGVGCGVGGRVARAHHVLRRRPGALVAPQIVVIAAHRNVLTWCCGLGCSCIDMLPGNDCAITWISHTGMSTAISSLMAL